jgi:hypothetical protein
MTRSSSKMALLAQLGAEPILCDVFDRDALIQAVRNFKPDVILNELTDLPDEVEKIGDHAELSPRIRTEGNQNVIEAARQSGSPKILAQTVAWKLPDGPDARAVAELESVLAEGLAPTTNSRSLRSLASRSTGLPSIRWSCWVNHRA